MVGQAVDVLRQAIGVEPLEGLHDPRVEGPASLLEQAPIRHVMGQGVLEGIFQRGEEARLIEELGRLQVHETSLECRLGQLREGL
jgi:hypothetical protein